MSTRKAKKVVIKEELVELTGDYKLAIVLNQMIYWSERVSDFDLFIKEEKERLSAEKLDSTNLELQNGWIYKTAEELADECMITSSSATMRRYLDKLVDSGWLIVRKNPKYRWDKTNQYRVDIYKIQCDLFEKGYFLEGYRHSFQNEQSNFQNEQSNFQNEQSNFQNEQAIPEITTDITSEITTEEKEKEEKEVHAHVKINPFQFFEENGFGLIQGYMAEKIGSWCDDLSDELVLEAMKLSVEHGIKNWRYVESILRDWFDKNIRTVEQARAAQRAFKEQQAKSRDKPKFGRKVRVEQVPDWLINQEEARAREEPEEDFDFEEEKRKLEEDLKKFR